MRRFGAPETCWRQTVAGTSRSAPACDTGPRSAGATTAVAGRAPILAISASEHVHPIWKAVWPEDPLPERLIDLARQLLLRAVDPQRASREAELGAESPRRPRSPEPRRAGCRRRVFRSPGALLCPLRRGLRSERRRASTRWTKTHNPTSATPRSSPQLRARAARPGIRRRATRSVAPSGCGGWAKPWPPRRGARPDVRRLGSARNLPSLRELRVVAGEVAGFECTVRGGSRLFRRGHRPCRVVQGRAMAVGRLRLASLAKDHVISTRSRP